MRKAIKDIRREELLQATLRTIEDVGLKHTTVAKIAVQADMSQGMVHHYFKNKAEILEASIRYANAMLRDEVLAELHKARSPAERIHKIVEVNFSPNWFNDKRVRLWISFCAETSHSPTLIRIQRVLHRRMRSNLLSSFKELFDPETSRQYTHELGCLIDGLWLQRSVCASHFDNAQALALVKGYLSRIGVLDNH